MKSEKQIQKETQKNPKKNNNETPLLILREKPKLRGPELLKSTKIQIRVLERDLRSTMVGVWGFSFQFKWHSSILECEDPFV